MIFQKADSAVQVWGTITGRLFAPRVLHPFPDLKGVFLWMYSDTRLLHISGLIAVQVMHIHPPGGYSNYFLTGCAAWGLKPLPISKDFSPSKNGWFKAFFEIFANRDPFLRVFLPQNGWFYHFFAIFAKWNPLLRIFLTKMGPMSKDFCWKSNPFGRHIPVCLNMWVPPPRSILPKLVWLKNKQTKKHLIIVQKNQSPECACYSLQVPKMFCYM